MWDDSKGYQKNDLYRMTEILDQYKKLYKKSPRPEYASRIKQIESYLMDTSQVRDGVY